MSCIDILYLVIWSVIPEEISFLSAMHAKYILERQKYINKT